MKSEVIDNFLPKEDFETLKSVMMGYHFPYYFNDSITSNNSEKEKNNKDIFYFTHHAYNEGSPQSDFFQLINKLLLPKINHFCLVRIKINCYPKTDKRIVHDQHVDYTNYKGKDPLKGLIYSLNTCNGGTILHNGDEIKSVGNRALFFDSNKPHSSVSCTDEKARFNININYL
jgi:hypothetical protein